MFPSKNNDKLTTPTQPDNWEEEDIKPKAVQEETNLIDNSVQKSAAPQSDTDEETKPRKTLPKVNKYNSIFQDTLKLSAQKIGLASKRNPERPSSNFDIDFSLDNYETDTCLEVSTDQTAGRSSSEDVFRDGSEKRKGSANVRESLVTSEDINVVAGPSGICPKSLKQEVGKEYVCPLCKKEFEYGQDFDTHYQTHKLECKICGKILPSEEALKSHLKVHYGRKKLYECRECNKKFDRKGNFDEHYRTHTGERPFVCKICTKRFTQKSVLHRHYSSHTNDKPHVCNVCGKKYTLRSSLKKHYETHSNDNPYGCEVCARRFTDKLALDKHSTTHTAEKKHVCEICKKIFSYLSHLKNHCTTHTGEKPFVCNVCNKPFTKQSNLTRHERLHTNEKPYECSVCRKTFTRKYLYDRHCNSAHK